MYQIHTNHFFAKIIQNLFWSILLFIPVFANAQTLEITATADKTDIFTGEQLTYTLKYKCASTTTNCTGVTIVASIPSGIIILPQTVGLTSDIAGYNVAPDYKSITFTFKEPLAAGNTGIIEFTGRAEFMLPNNTVATLSAQILSNGTPAASANVNTTIHSYDNFCPQIVGGTGLGLDNTTSYIVHLQRAITSTAQGAGPLGNVQVVAQLPANTIIDSVRLFTDYPSNFTLPLGTVNISGTTITVDVPANNMNVVVNGYVTSIQVRVYVRYPSASFTAGQSVTNSVTVTEGSNVLTNNSVVTYDYGDTYALKTTRTCTTKLDATDVLQAPLSKLQIKKVGDSQLKPGETGQYSLTFKNAGNTVLDNVVVEDIIPNSMEVHNIYVANGFITGLSGSEQVQFWIKTVGNPIYTQVSPLYQQIYPPVTGDIITAYKVTIDHLPAGAYTNAANILFYTVSTSATVGSTIQNCLTATTSTSGATIDNTSACANTNIIPLDAYSTLKMQKVFTDEYGGGIGGSNVTRGTFVYSTLHMNVLGGGQPLQKPMVMDLLPKGVDYIDFHYGVSYSFYGASSTIPAPTADLVEVIPNYNGSGRTLVRFTWNTPWAAPSDYAITLKLKVNDLAIAGTSALYSYEDTYFKNPFKELKGLKNPGFFTGSSPKKCAYVNYYYQFYETLDSLDLDGNGKTLTDTLCYGTSYIGVTSQAQMESVKWVKGACDTDYSKYPNFGQTIPGGLANYKLIVSNTGNVPSKDIQIVDILPWVGDAGVIDPQARLTEWRPNLVTPLQTPPGVVVYYSTEKNPCRTDYVASGPAGCTVTNWTTILPQDPTTIQALKLDFGNKVLNPGDQVELTWEMRAPVNAPTNNEIAWNSFGFKATRADNNDPFLPSEPFKVGIKLKPNIPSNYGDYVWLDANKNGIQDIGESGIDGVRVELYKDNGDGLNDPTIDTRVDFTSTANGGLYLFSSIPVGDYYAVFFLPPGYTTSTANTTTDDKDSDGILGNFNGNRVTIVPLTNIASAETDLTWDQGIYPDKAAVGNYVWFDENQNNIQDESSANGINGVKVCLYKSDNTLVATTNTTNDVYGRPGYYLFEELEPGDYYIQFKPTPDKTYTPNTGAVGGTTSDETDSDADSGTGKTATFTLTAGEVDLTWDAGLIIQTGPYKLGNFVWSDVNNNGLFDTNEAGVNNVVVNLYNDTNNDNKPQPDEFVTTTLTGVAAGINGIYVFDRLPEGNYIVQIPDQNFTGILKDYISSTGNDPNSDPDDNIENDDNGTLVAGCGVISKPITLGNNAEPLDAGKTNYTVDFGFYKCNKPNYAANVIQPDCAGGVGSIAISGGTVGDKVGYTIGSTFTGSYASATAISSLTGGVVVGNIAGSSNDVTYAIRIFNGEESCYQDFIFTISKLQCCNLSASATGANAKCNGSTDGSATATPSGNIGAVTYLWSNSGTTASISGLIAGTYTVTVTENASCTATASYTVIAPTALSLTCSKVDVTTISGTNGEASVTATGGTSPYTYAWSNGATSATISNLLAGTYTVTVSDANACTSVCSSTINEPGCTAPTLGTNTPATGTCTGTTPNDDATITFAGVTNATKADRVVGASYGTSPAYGDATNADASTGNLQFTGLKHNTTYTFRFWNGASSCYTDITITTPSKTCTLPCPPQVCTPIKVIKN